MNEAAARGFPRQCGLRGHLPAGLGGAASRDERNSDGAARRAPVLALACAALGLWEASGPALRDSALCAAGAERWSRRRLSPIGRSCFRRSASRSGTTLEALAFAVIGGVALAVLFARSPWLEHAFLPLAIALQVTPMIAIAPLLLIYLDAHGGGAGLRLSRRLFPDPVESRSASPRPTAILSICSRSTARRAANARVCCGCRQPCPIFLGGLRIGGGLALIGAMAAELAAGAAGQGAGLAFRIVEAGYRLKIPMMFAALVLISLAGIAIFASVSALSAHLLGRWHESALER